MAKSLSKLTRKGEWEWTEQQQKGFESLLNAFTNGPYLLPIITLSVSSAKPKASTLRPLDMDTNIRAPQQYVKTRVYEEGLVEEATYLLADYLSAKPVHASVAFPEVVTPVIVMLRRALKVGKASTWKSKEVGMIKGLVERIEESVKWVEKKRSSV